MYIQIYCVGSTPDSFVLVSSQEITAYNSSLPVSVTVSPPIIVQQGNYIGIASPYGPLILPDTNPNTSTGFYSLQSPSPMPLEVGQSISTTYFTSSPSWRAIAVPYGNILLGASSPPKSGLSPAATGAIIAVVLFVALSAIAAAIILFVIRRRRGQRESPSSFVLTGPGSSTPSMISFNTSTTPPMSNSPTRQSPAQTRTKAPTVSETRSKAPTVSETSKAPTVSTRSKAPTVLEKSQPTILGSYRETMEIPLALRTNDDPPPFNADLIVPVSKPKNIQVPQMPLPVKPPRATAQFQWPPRQSTVLVAPGTEPQYFCARCDESLSTIFCDDCYNYFCQNCSNELHSTGQWTNHLLTEFT